MRIFLIWAGRYDEIDTLISVLQKRGHKILYWAGSRGHEDKAPGAIFHDHFDAFRGIPASGVDIEEFPPPSKELIERFYKTESLILTMMNKHFGGVCVDKRKNAYYNMLQYWYGMLRKYKPEAIIFPNIPHTVYNYIIYELAKFLGIKTIMIENTRACNRAFVFTDWRQGSAALQRELTKNKGKNFSLDDLSQDIREYYQSQSDSRCDSTTLDMQHQIKEYSWQNKWLKRLKKSAKNLIRGTLPITIAKYIFRQFQPNLKKEYTRLQTEPDFSKPFVYAPLGYQPELAASPRGDIFCNQILMVKILAASLPKEWLIYVKEHPVQWWRRGGVEYSDSRYPGYYEQLSKIKNVRLAPVNTDSIALINKSKAVAALTGTAGWEAILRGIPAIIFGYPWYRDCPGILRADSVESCKQAFKRIEQGFRPNQEQIINYLKCLDKVSIKAYMFPELAELEEIPNLTKEQSKENIAQAVISKLEEKAVV